MNIKLTVDMSEYNAKEISLDYNLNTLILTLTDHEGLITQEKFRPENISKQLEMFVSKLIAQGMHA